MTDSLDESSIIRGLRNGDRSAWTAMYDQYSAGLWRYVARLTGGDRSEVADIVQETFVEAAHLARRFDESKGTLASWLCGIAHHKLLNYFREIRQQVRVREKTLSRGELQNWWTDRDVSAALETAELVELVRETLSRLSAEHAGLLHAKYIDEMSLIEIQQQWGGSSDAVRSKLKRARQAFRELFDKAMIDSYDTTAADRT